MKPRIAIPVPTATDLAYSRRAWPAYAEAVSRSGGEPVAIELDRPAASMREAARSCSGVCLPGSVADVDPALYAAERDPATDVADPAREAVDTLLLEDAARQGKPVLAICFGLQMLNAWSGGALVQDLTPLPVNHAAGSTVAVAHSVLVARNTLLASLLDREEVAEKEGFLRLPVNTSHHQSVAVPGAGLRVVARCPDDGVIEALELDPAIHRGETDGGGAAKTTVRPRSETRFLLGVQWHPERSYDISATSRALFGRLVAEAAKSAVTAKVAAAV